MRPKLVTKKGGPVDPALTLTRKEVVAVHFALLEAIDAHKREINEPSREHGMAEAAIALVDLRPLSQKIKQWLEENPR